jgi:hypothetical protein
VAFIFCEVDYGSNPEFSKHKDRTLTHGALSMKWRPLLLVLTRDAKSFWIAVAGLAASVGIAFFTGSDLPSRILYAGTVLDFFGLVLVAQGLSETRKQFGKPSVFGRLRRWFEAFASTFRRQEHQRAVAATGRFSLRTGHVRARVGVGQNATVEQRVHALEQNLKILSSELTEVRSSHDLKLAKIETALEEEKKQRVAEMGQLSRQLEDLAVGDLHLETIGLFWLVLGILFTNIPNEISRLLLWSAHIFR